MRRTLVADEPHRVLRDPHGRGLTNAEIAEQLVVSDACRP
jgi:hypothetical protein